MISWLDIVSLPLRRVHDQWVAVRGNRIMPDIGDYAGFAGRMPQGVSACIAVPAREPVPKFVFVGDVMRRYLPGCRSGIAVDEVPSVVTRISVSDVLSTESRHSCAVTTSFASNPFIVSPQFS